MNKHIAIFFITMAIAFADHQLFAQSMGTVTIKITNFKTSDGNAVVNLFRDQDDIPKKPFMTMKAVIMNGDAKVSFGNLPQGSYAAIAYHDENENGTLDHKLGFPNEPMGFSNNWHLSLFSGMPNFKKLKFDHNKANTAIEIKID